MKFVPRMIIVSLMFLILFSQMVFAQEADNPADVLVIEGDQDQYHLGPYLNILKDSSGDLTIEEVTSQEYQEQWFTTQLETPNFGFQTIPYWVSFRIRNESEQDQQYVLALGFRNTHYMDLYTPDPNGESFNVTKNGIFSGK